MSTSTDSGKRQRQPRTTGDRLRHFADHISYLKLVVLAGVGLLICGFAVRQYVGDVITAEDLDKTVEEPLRVIESTAQRTAQRVDRLETSSGSFDKRLDRQDHRMDMQGQQLYEIATRVGARRIPGLLVAPDAGVFP